MVVAPVASAAPARPRISSVTFSGSGGNYTVVVRGNGFGRPTVALPFTGDVPNFRIEDDADLAAGESGYNGDPYTLEYLVWNRNEIEVAGLHASPGDAIVVGVQNAASGVGATWGGNVSPVPAGTPVVTSVSFANLRPGAQPAFLRIVVKGSGFGPAPGPLASGQPYVGDLDAFYLWDGQVHCGASSALTAGGSYFGQRAADAVTLKYVSWTDTRIVIGGLGGSYGAGCETIGEGDAVAVGVWNSGVATEGGPQTAGHGSVFSRVR